MYSLVYKSLNMVVYFILGKIFIPAKVCVCTIQSYIWLHMVLCFILGSHYIPRFLHVRSRHKRMLPTTIYIVFVVFGTIEQLVTQSTGRQVGR